MDERLNYTIGLQEDGCLPGIHDFSLVPDEKAFVEAEW
jgi:hypothetical protein